MNRRIITLFLILSIFLVAASDAQSEGYVIATIRIAYPVVLGEKSVIVLGIKGRSESYIVRTVDAPKFGLLKPETAASRDRDKMAEELTAVKGWRVKLTLENPDKREIRVIGLERLPDK
jgi:hypothetical protein